jgi:pantoate--beta-alanine ligase
MAIVVKEIAEMRRIAGSQRLAGKRIGVVPTMGCLHEGHLSLIRIAQQHADVIICTIFVNPKQFLPGEDYERYPRDLERDVSLAEEAGAGYVFAPAADAMYKGSHRTYVEIEQLGTLLEGKARPGHFRGVATVVAKLFNITQPHVAVFGQKDAQQVVMIRQMIRDLDFNVDLIVGPTVREPDGLAMSSRNAYLTAQQRLEASVLYRSLQLARQKMQEGTGECADIIRAMKELIETHSSGVIDYISLADAESLGELSSCRGRGSVLVSLAVRFGAARLIDNITVNT